MDRTLRPFARLLGGLLLALSMLAVGGCGDDESSSGGAAQGDTIKFGLIAPFSGPNATYGPPERASLQLAVEDINASGGITVADKKYKLELKTYDSGNEPTTGVTAAQRAVHQDGVKFMEVFGGTVIPAVQPVTEPAESLVFAMASKLDFLGSDHPYTFGIYFDSVDGTVANVRHLKDTVTESDPKLLMVATDDAIGHRVAPAAAEEAEKLGYTTSIEFVPTDLEDFAAILNKYISRDVSVIDTGVLAPTQYATLVEQARKLGYEGTFSFPDTIDMRTLTEAAGKAAAAGSVASPVWELANSQAGRHWRGDVGKKEGGDPNQTWTTISYDNLFLLKDAIEETQSLEAADVAKTLLKVTSEGALGSVHYDAQRELQTPWHLVEVREDGTTKTLGEAQ